MTITSLCHVESASVGSNVAEDSLAISRQRPLHVRVRRERVLNEKPRPIQSAPIRGCPDCASFLLRESPCLLTPRFSFPFLPTARDGAVV